MYACACPHQSVRSFVGMFSLFSAHFVGPFIVFHFSPEHPSAAQSFPPANNVTEKRNRREKSAILITPLLSLPKCAAVNIFSVHILSYFYTLRSTISGHRCSPASILPAQASVALHFRAAGERSPSRLESGPPPLPYRVDFGRCGRKLTSHNRMLSRAVHVNQSAKHRK